MTGITYVIDYNKVSGIAMLRSFDCVHSDLSFRSGSRYAFAINQHHKKLMGIIVTYPVHLVEDYNVSKDLTQKFLF